MADKIVAEYTVKVDKALKDLDRLAKKVDKVDDERKKTQAGFKTMSNDMVSSFKKVGAAFGLAFGAKQVISLGKEAVKLASQLEGVERAFKRIGGANSDNLLQGLRTATRGTVSDLVLMQKAVQASNFKIPLENLASLFKFAQARARETGESVEYLTQSIVLGIGRKSPLILDNLGISAVELRERLKGVGVEAANVGDIAQIIGDIAEEELAKMGDQADTTADKLAQMGTAYQNALAKGGDALIEVANYLAIGVGLVSEFESELAKLDETWQGLSYSALSKEFESQKEKLDSLNKSYQEFLNFGQDKLDVQTGVEVQKNLLKELRLQNEIVDAIEGQVKARKELVESANGQDDLEYITPEQVEALKKASEEVLPTFVNNIVLLNDQLKDLKTQLSEAAIGGSEFFDLTKKIADKTKEINEAIAQTKLQDAFIIDKEPFEEINTNLDNYVEETENATTAATDAWEAHFNELMAGQDEAFNNEKAKREESTQQAFMYFGALADLASSLSSLQSQLVDNELQSLDEQLKRGAISREEYEAERKELLSQQAEDEKQAALFQATINGILAVVNAYSIDPTGILSAITGAIVAAEIAAIAAKPTPQFAEGGWVDGKGLIHGRSHARGGVKIEAEGNEYITKGKYAKPNAEILEAINTGNWERYKMENIITPAINQVLEGGFGGMGGSAILNNSFNDRNLLTAFDRNRKSERQSAMFIVSELSRSLKGRKRGGYA